MVVKFVTILSLDALKKIYGLRNIRFFSFLIKILLLYELYIVMISFSSYSTWIRLLLIPLQLRNNYVVFEDICRSQLGISIKTAFPTIKSLIDTGNSSKYNTIIS